MLTSIDTSVSSHTEIPLIPCRMLKRKSQRMRKKECYIYTSVYKNGYYTPHYTV